MSCTLLQVQDDACRYCGNIHSSCQRATHQSSQKPVRFPARRTRCSGQIRRPLDVGLPNSAWQLLPCGAVLLVHTPARRCAGVPFQ